MRKVSRITYTYICGVSQPILRCVAHRDDLDNLEEPRPADRSEDHTTTLIEEYSVKKLWDGWGVVADVTVSD